MKRPVLYRAAVGLTAVALAATACGGSGTSTKTASGSKPSHSAGTGTTTATGAKPATETAAADLRAGLDGLLRQHVNLAATTFQTAFESGLDSPRTAGAVKALDANSVGLSQAVGSVYGDAAGQQFLALWRKHIGFFVTYAKGAATNNAAMKAQANAELDGYRADFGAFIDSATKGGLPKAAVAEDLKGHVSSLEMAIDALAAKSPDAGAKVEMAAMHMDGTAKVLAVAIAKQFSAKIAGNPASNAAELRAGLTGLLQQHVAQTGIVVQTAVASGLTAPQTAGAVKALDRNSVDLAAAIESVYGKPAADQFLALWRKHIGFFVDYTKGAATNNAAMKQKALQDLDGYSSDFGAFVESATMGKLTKGAVAANLGTHVQTLAAAIDAMVAKSPDAAAKLAVAEDHMSMTAKVLASAFAQQFPAKFAG